MATGSITKASVDALEPGERDRFLWDKKLSGFGVKITPSGRRVYLLQYRLGGRGTPTKRYTIGPHGKWTPATARSEAERLAIKVSQGTDPRAEKIEKVRVATELAFDAMLEEFIQSYLRKKWKRSHAMAERLLRTHASPVLGRKPLPLIKKADIEAVLDRLPEDQPGLRLNTFAVVRTFFRWAVKKEHITRSPTQAVDVPEGPEERDRKLEDWELRLAWEAAGSLGYPFGPFYRLLALAGQRREEVAGLDWRELDREHAEWLLPAERAKNGHATLIHLTAAMIAELDGIAAGSNWPRRGLVFSTTGRAPISGYSRGKKRLDAAIAKLVREREDPEVAPWTVHDFRRTQATGLQRLGFRSEVIESVQNRITGRSRPGSAKVYQRYDWEPERILAFQAWSAHVERLANGATSNVIVLSGRKA
jgi:integrase